MKIASISVVLFILGVQAAQISFGQSITAKTAPPTDSITITEPGIIPLGQVFKTADVVAVVRVVSGDTENYKTAVHRTKAGVGIHRFPAQQECGGRADDGPNVCLWYGQILGGFQSGLHRNGNFLRMRLRREGL